MSTEMYEWTSGRKKVMELVDLWKEMWWSIYICRRPAACSASINGKTTPAPASLQRLQFSSACQSPATTILQHLPFSNACHSPAPTILQRLPFSSDYHFPAPPFSSVYSAYHFLVTTVSAPPALKWFAPRPPEHTAAVLQLTSHLP
jgi:hypothetical protein